MGTKIEDLVNHCITMTSGIDQEVVGLYLDLESELGRLQKAGPIPDDLEGKITGAMAHCQSLMTDQDKTYIDSLRELQRQLLGLDTVH